jgi:hypothetical protein
MTNTSINLNKAKASSSNQKLFIAKTWIKQWDVLKLPQANKNVHFFTRNNNDGEYSPSNNFHFNNLILGGKFPALKDTLGGLKINETAVMDVLDPNVEHIEHVHIEGISQILIDINVMSQEEANVLRGETGIKRVLQSNIGGPKEDLNSLEDTARKWTEGETPGCDCLICNRVPEVLKKLTDNSVMTPKDVLPLTNLPQLHKVVDNLLQPEIKFVLGSQGRLGENIYQEYPSAAVGHSLYPQSNIDNQATFKLSKESDPKGIMLSNNAPLNYEFRKGIFWENGKTMQRLAGDPDQHVFGFIYTKKNIEIENLEKELNRFQPII